MYFFVKYFQTVGEKEVKEYLGRTQISLLSFIMLIMFATLIYMTAYFGRGFELIIFILIHAAIFLLIKSWFFSLVFSIVTTVMIAFAVFYGFYTDPLEKYGSTLFIIFLYGVIVFILWFLPYQYDSLFHENKRLRKKLKKSEKYAIEEELIYTFQEFKDISNYIESSCRLRGEDGFYFLFDIVDKEALTFKSLDKMLAKALSKLTRKGIDVTGKISNGKYAMLVQKISEIDESLLIKEFYATLSELGVATNTINITILAKHYSEVDEGFFR